MSKFNEYLEAASNKTSYATLEKDGKKTTVAIYKSRMISGYGVSFRSGHITQHLSDKKKDGIIFQKATSVNDVVKRLEGPGFDYKVTLRHDLYAKDQSGNVGKKSEDNNE